MAHLNAPRTTPPVLLDFTSSAPAPIIKRAVSMEHTACVRHRLPPAQATRSPAWEAGGEARVLEAWPVQPPLLPSRGPQDAGSKGGLGHAGSQTGPRPPALQERRWPRQGPGCFRACCEGQDHSAHGTRPCRTTPLIPSAVACLLPPTSAPNATHQGGARQPRDTSVCPWLRQGHPPRP